MQRRYNYKKLERNIMILSFADKETEKIFEQKIQFFTGVFDCTLCVLSFDYLAGTCFK